MSNRKTFEQCDVMLFNQCPEMRLLAQVHLIMINRNRNSIIK